MGGVLRLLQSTSNPLESSALKKSPSESGLNSISKRVKLSPLKLKEAVVSSTTDHAIVASETGAETPIE